MGVLTRAARAAIVAGLPAWHALAAQVPGGIELGALGEWAIPDGAFGLDPGVGGGVRLGWRAGPWGLEVGGGAAHAGGPVSATLWRVGAAATAHLAAGRHLAFVGAGYARVGLSGDAPFGFSDNALLVMVGDRWFLSSRTALRVDVQGLLTDHGRSAAATRAGHVVVSTGLSFLLAAPQRRRGADGDRDGVSDDQDHCRATPVGAVVDGRGCPSDSDRDGVWNGLDACPNTPTGVLIDHTGCPLDADGDHVYDGLDQCPETPAGAAVDGHGCPLDADGDGVPDGVDRCAGTGRGAAVDAAGCPLDTDGDGVPDGIDRCPGTVRGVAVDAAGCPSLPAVAPQAAPAAPPVLFTPERASVTLRGVNFETGMSRLRPESYAVLDGVAAALRAAPEIRIAVAGYTDNTGSAAVNQRLSEARAAAVRAYLARRGVDPGRMIARGYGPADPVASNATAAGRAQNRRVELHRID